MKRYPSSLRCLLCVGVGLAVLGAVSPCLSAQVELSVQLGFENRVTPGHYAPIRVEIRGLPEATTGRLTVVQPIGNAWRGEATAEQDLGYTVGADGVYSNAIPIYDPANPIRIQLRSDAGPLLAETTLDLRSTLRTGPYLVLDKQIPRFDEEAALIDVVSLPERWWALDSARSMWLASSLTSDAWTSISQWVVAGGSLVVLTGTEFYRMDSPVLRWLLPISDPQLVTSEAGVPHIEGILGDATVDLVSEEGFPLLVQTSRGAGHIALVTVSPQSLTGARLREIAEHVMPASLLSITDTANYLLGEEPVSTLNSLHVVLLGVVVVGIVGAVVVAGRRSPKLGWGILFAATVILSVLVGFISNPRNVVADVTILNTSLSLDISVPLTIASTGLFSQMSGTVAVAHEDGRIPAELLPRTLDRDTSYDFWTYPEHTDVQVGPSETHRWHSYGTASPLVDMELVNSSTVRIRQFYPFDFEDAWVVIDGTAYVLPGLAQGIHEYPLDLQSAVNLAVLGSSAAARDALASTLLIRDLREALPLRTGIWLVAISDRSSAENAQLARKVRDITVAVVAEKGGADGAI